MAKEMVDKIASAAAASAAIMHRRTNWLERLTALEQKRNTVELKRGQR
jgi:hypothetical protein